MNLTQHEQGFVLVATGLNYRREAEKAAAQLRSVMPDARICVVTDEIEGPAFWDDVVVLEKPTFSFRDKIAMRLCPYAKVMYLDTDVYALLDFTEVFQLLEQFEFAGHQLAEGHDCPLPGIPETFCEIQGGVMAFCNTPRVQAFFDAWEANYDSFRAQNKDGYHHYSNVSDQKSLRKSLYFSNLRLAVLAPEYNFVPYRLAFACARVRLLHSRGDKQLAALAQRINRVLGNRVYVPALDTVITDDPSQPELFRLWWKTGLQLLRRLSRSCLPAGLRQRLRQSRTIREQVLGTKFTEADSPSTTKWD